MRNGLLPTLLLVASAVSLLAAVAPALAQEARQVNPDGAGFAVPPKDSVTPPTAGGEGSMAKIIIVAVAVAVGALGVAFAMKKKGK